MRNFIIHIINALLPPCRTYVIDAATLLKVLRG